MRVLWVAGGLLAVAAAVAGCGGVSATTPAPAETPAAAPGTHSPSPTANRIAPATVRAGSDGLTVRYTGDDGSLKTLRVEDFRR